MNTEKPKLASIKQSVEAVMSNHKITTNADADEFIASFVKARQTKARKLTAPYANDLAVLDATIIEQYYLTKKLKEATTK